MIIKISKKCGVVSYSLKDLARKLIYRRTDVDVQVRAIPLAVQPKFLGKTGKTASDICLHAGQKRHVTWPRVYLLCCVLGRELDYVQSKHDVLLKNNCCCCCPFIATTHFVGLKWQWLASYGRGIFCDNVFLSFFLSLFLSFFHSFFFLSFLPSLAALSGRSIKSETGDLI